eukprot:scaffold4380_cov161-Skeletonema_marinoi.AAC.2
MSYHSRNRYCFWGICSNVGSQGIWVNPCSALRPENARKNDRPENLSVCRVVLLLARGVTTPPVIFCFMANK